MASRIIFQDINEFYPVAGVDNDTQGFRNNFKLIKDALSVSKSEIEELQSNSASLVNNNNFDGNIITNAVFSGTQDGRFWGGTNLGANVVINYSNGPYQTFNLSGNVTFTFSNFPTANCGKITLQFTASGSYTINFAAASGYTLRKRNFPTSITIDSSANPLIIDVWSSTTDNSDMIILMDYKGLFTQ